jgi:glucuronoarabinoxylan endo-1,4-beta-xylanase
MRTSWRSALAVAALASLLACSSAEQHRDVTVTWDDVKQTIEGFGAASVFFGGNITEDVADQLFDAKKGIGLSLLRTQIGLPDDVQSDGSEPDGANPVATAPEVTTAQQAIARGAKVWAAAWTPPPIWKTTNNKNGSGDGYPSNELKSSHYQEYADYLAGFVDLMAKANVPLIGISPANEPDYTATWDNAQWSPDELATFITKNLGPTFEEHCPSVKIVAPDTADWPSVDRYLDPLLADSAGKKYLGIVATHPYQNSSAPIVLDYQRPKDNGKTFWETEWSQENMKGDTPDPTMTSAIDMARKIHDHMTISNLNAWSWWSIYITADSLTNYSSKTRQNPAFIQPDKSMGDPYMFKRGYAFGNWSKFVRPGFQRIGATDKPTGNVLIEAYRDGSHLAIIAINAGSGTVTQKFTIDGGSVDRLTPWVTSPGDNLVAKDSISASGGFTYDLPGQSLVTFVSWDAKNETPGLVLPPTEGKDAGADTKTSSGNDCSAPVVPNNLVSGGVTDFTDWKGSTGKWGDTQGLYGAIYAYPGTKMTANVDTTAKNLHVKGSVAQGDYGGAGLAFSVCATVASFSQVQFTLAGDSPGCDLELQIKTFAQQPIDNPPGICYQDASASCYQFPVAKQVAVPTHEAKDVVISLDKFSSWSPENAAQVVGIQWQWTGMNVDPDASDGCPIDVTITGIKFLP